MTGAKALREELDRLRAEVAELRPKPPAPGPVWTGAQVAVRYARTYWLTSPAPGAGTRAVPDGDPAAASLLGRGGVPTPVDRGWLDWLRHLGVEFEEVR